MTTTAWALLGFTSQAASGLAPRQRALLLSAAITLFAIALIHELRL